MKYIADLHVHTVASGHAYNTIYELAHEGKKKKLKYIAMTDHGPTMGGAPHVFHFANLRALPDFIEGVRILRGIEANIINEKGDLDLSDEYMKDLDIVLASFHLHLGYDGSSERKNTDAMLKAIKHPKLNILAHPGNPSFPVNIPEVVKAAKENGVLIEINNSSFSGNTRLGSRDNCLAIAKEVKKQGWKVSFGSDAHCIDHLAEFTFSEKLAKEAGLTADDIVNTSQDMVKRYIINKK